tara:strand:+ start:502 stop:756 length:255 start_codon:yes stop_codon:yes gene_type:complete
MAQELETVKASLNIEVNVDCPNCGLCLDLLDHRDTNSNYHNEDGYVLIQACGGEQLTTNHEAFEVEEVTCSYCMTEFNVKGIEW